MERLIQDNKPKQLVSIKGLRDKTRLGEKCSLLGIVQETSIQTIQLYSICKTPESGLENETHKILLDFEKELAVSWILLFQQTTA